MNRTCTKCKVEKTTTEFRKRKGKAGFKSWCNHCENEYNKRYYYTLSKDKINSYARSQYRKDPEKARRRRQASRYRLTINTFEDLVDSVGEACNICGIPLCPSGRNLSLDHNHETNRIRGFLCLNCNQGIGKFKEDSKLLQKAIEYILFWKD